jgi:BirA family biotin operon repressor/biotin-[acetyl-CoA-carboxylase] ligase
MSEPREVWQFDTRHVGRRVLVYDTLASTNDAAADLASRPGNAGTVVVADYQTTGRGQYGRSWVARPGSALLLSVLISTPEPLRRPVVLTAWAAVGVAEAIRTLTGVQARIKWPNDLLVRGKKVCGILIEQRVGTVVGIGLNLTQSADEFAAARLPDATSLVIATGAVIETRLAASTVVRQLDAEYARLTGGEVVPLEADWKWRIGLLGRHVTAVLANGETISGRLRDLTFDGVELDIGGDVPRVLRPELVRQLLPVS